ncbi:centrosomal protein 43-like isoform X6 [Xyrauchen texanus]|uniref:centrosomal protein 43-like isoform X6 n=1 Tax=Xyrauchen texanus TaxID=154827 RepID=UPI0022425289|nr:centrosomal protein 43-like isoform X6 [Xyrauchen texanus]
MSATEEDTELRDLLIQNLENSGVLNKIKAELRAAVFLALEEQDKVENKTPLVNENLKKSLNTKDGRLVAGLITDFLQVFNLDFTVAVFQPEINTYLNGLDSRESLLEELGISESEVNRNTPLLLELVKRGRHKDKTSIFTEGGRVASFPKELLPCQIAEARKTFDCHDKDKSDEINRDAVIAIFSDLFPQFSRNMLESYVNEELRAKGKDANSSMDFQEFLGMYKCFFMQCQSVVTTDYSEILHSSSKSTEDRIISPSASKIPRYKGFVKHSSAQEEKADPKTADRRHGETLGIHKSRGSVQVLDGSEKGLDDWRSAPTPLRRALDLGMEDEDEEGDSFFDDPLPKPQKTYGWSDRLGSISGKALSAGVHLKSTGGSISVESSQRDHVSNKNGTSSSKDKGVKDFQAENEKSRSPLLDEDLDYDDDFNSHRSEVSIDEEIEEVSIEGPDISEKFDETTQDVSVSQISLGADYMEDVA